MERVCVSSILTLCPLIVRIKAASIRSEILECSPLTLPGTNFFNVLATSQRDDLRTLEHEGIGAIADFPHSYLPERRELLQTLGITDGQQLTPKQAILLSAEIAKERMNYTACLYILFLTGSYRYRAAALGLSRRCGGFCQGIRNAIIFLEAFGKTSSYAQSR